MDVFDILQMPPAIQCFKNCLSVKMLALKTYVQINCRHIGGEIDPRVGIHKTS